MAYRGRVGRGRTSSGAYVALLRGVNNVGKGVVAMADLRDLFASLGFRDVGTVRNSGNVVFSAATKCRADLVGTIEKALASTLRLSARVAILSADEVAAVVRENPLADVATHPSHLLVFVPRVASDLVRLKFLQARRWAPERLALGRRVAYLWCANGVGRSPLWPAVDRAVARAGGGTARTIATMTKIMALVEATGDGR